MDSARFGSPTLTTKRFTGLGSFRFQKTTVSKGATETATTCENVYMLLDPVRRFAYLMRSANRLPAWRDDRVFRAEETGGINRIEFLGLPGIGKSYFNNKLTEKLGEISLKSQGAREQAADYEAAFARLFRLQLEKSLPAEASKTVRLSKLRNFMQVMELDDFISQNQIPGVFTTASGLVHWTKPAMKELIEAEPDVVREVMSGRLVVYCSSDEPGRRSTEGLVKRGSIGSDRLREDVFSRRNLADQAMADLAASFESLEIPVVRLNLDRQADQNITSLCRDLEALGIRSRHISWRSRK